MEQVWQMKEQILQRKANAKQDKQNNVVEVQK